MGSINKTWWVGAGWKMMSLVLEELHRQCLHATGKDNLEVQKACKRKLKGSWYSFRVKILKLFLSNVEK